MKVVVKPRFTVASYPSFSIYPVYVPPVDFTLSLFPSVMLISPSTVKSALEPDIVNDPVISASPL